MLRQQAARDLLSNPFNTNNMGKVTKKILGATRGKVGDVVFRKFRQMNVNSSYQPNPLNPDTKAQQLQRGIFAVMSKTATSMAKGIKVGFGYKAKGTNLSPRNWFVRTNKEWFTSNQPGIVTISYPELVMSLGRTCEADFNALDFDDANVVGVSWTPLSTAVDTNAELHIVVVCPDNEGCLVSTAAKLSEGSVNVSTPDEWNGLKVHCYAIETAVADHPEDDIVKGQTYRSVYLGQGNIG